MAKAKVNVNGGGARVLNVRTTPRPTPSPSRGEGGGLGRMQFPPGWGGQAGAKFQVGVGNSPNPMITGTLGVATNQITLQTQAYKNQTDKPQVVLILGDFGSAAKWSGSPVVNGCAPVVMVDGVAQGPAGAGGWVDGGALGMHTHIARVLAGQTISVELRVALSIISGSGAFGFYNNKVDFLAVAAE